MNELYVSVIMPVYASSKYFTQAFYSILNQSYKEFEFLIIKNKKADVIDAIIEEAEDTRINTIYTTDKISAFEAYNLGFSNASHNYIFIMDHDDISHENRIEIQLSYVKQYALDICGTFYEIIDYIVCFWP